MERGKDYLTPSDLAKKLGVTERTIQLWIKKGDINAYRLANSRNYRILPTEAERLINPVQRRPEIYA